MPLEPPGQPGRSMQTEMVFNYGSDSLCSLLEPVFGLLGESPTLGKGKKEGKAILGEHIILGLLVLFFLLLKDCKEKILHT